MAFSNLAAMMKEKNLGDDPKPAFNKKPGLLKKRQGMKPSQSTEVQPLMKRLTGK